MLEMIEIHSEFEKVKSEQIEKEIGRVKTSGR